MAEVRAQWQGQYQLESRILRFYGSMDLFEGLKISCEEKYRNLQGTYPVIFLTFAEIKDKTYSSARGKMALIISELYLQYSYLLKSDVLEEGEKKYFRKIAEDYGKVTDDELTVAVKRLAGFLEKFYHKKVIVLLDEYDTPMQEAYVGGYWEDIMALFRSLFNSTFKTNPYLECGLLTGITRVSKESVFSDLNNLDVVTTTSDKYAACFGFAEEEVFAALEEFGLSDMREQVKAWYDGFTFGKLKDIYNPWSITQFLDKKNIGPYWANTSSNGLINHLVQTGSGELKQSMEQLLKGGALETELEEEIVYHQLDSTETAIWSLLLASGYLKTVSFTVHERTRKPRYKLMITNFETQLMFEDFVCGWFERPSARYQSFVKALLVGNLEDMNEDMNDMSRVIFSSFDGGNHPSERTEPERFYHGLVLGLIVGMRDDYIITSNRESGRGRYDIMMEPRQEGRDAIVIEFKVFNPRREKSLEETVEAALKQIRDKSYDTNLLEKGISSERIRHYGFAFAGKEVLIGTDKL